MKYPAILNAKNLVLNFYFFRKLSVLVLSIVFLSFQQVSAFTTSDFSCAVQGDFGGTCFYSSDCANDGSTVSSTTDSSSTDSCGCSTGGTSTTSFGPGTLPSYVKEPYNSIFTAAAAKYNIDPAALVGIFYNEQYGFTNSVSTFEQHTWPNPPPPYGSGVPWNNGGGAGAEGPFQFLPSTWTSQGVDGNGDGKADPNDLTDAAFGAAHYLSDGDLGGIKITQSSDEHDITTAISYYYGAGAGIPNTYGEAAYTIYAKVKTDEGASSSGDSTSSVATSGSTTTSSDCGGGTTTSSSTDCSSSGSTVTGDAEILCEAEQYSGIYYLWGGGHDGYANFRQGCPISSLSSAASASTAGDPGPCATDCAGLVSMALDQAFNQTFDWTVDETTGKMVGAGADKWQPIKISQAQPGDIVTFPGHVEIVKSINGNNLVTFGSHYTGTQTSAVTSAPSYWTTGAWHWSGSGSNGT
jgi:hypothetical protein